MMIFEIKKNLQASIPLAGWVTTRSAPPPVRESIANSTFMGFCIAMDLAWPDLCI